MGGGRGGVAGPGAYIHVYIYMYIYKDVSLVYEDCLAYVCMYIYI